MKNILDRRLRHVKTDKFVIDLNMPKDYPPIKARRTAEGGVRDRFFAAKAELPDEITVVRPFDTSAFTKSCENTFYVAENGDNNAKGTKDSPLADLHTALDKVRGLGGARIIMRGGNYRFTESARITSEHSGTEASPLIITAEDGETPYISGSYSIPSSAFKPVNDEKMLARLKPEARAHVLCADLPSLGITDFGIVGYGGAVLMIDNIPQTLSRYPNKGEKQIVMSDNIYDAGGHKFISPDSQSRDNNDPWEIGITDPRCLEWEWHEDIWIYGALYAEWGRRYAPIGAFDREKMSMKGRYAFEWGVKYAPDNDYYFLNIFEELDEPGEWYLDRKSGKLYYYPTEEGISENSDIRFIASPCNLIVGEGAENVIVEKLNVGRCAGAGFSVNNCTQFLIQNCTVTGTCEEGDAQTAIDAVSIKGGKRNGMIASTIEHFTNHAAFIDGGDRANLIPANNFLQNCFILNPHCRIGISEAGCGNIMSHNYVHNTTMGAGGDNEGIVEYNIVEGGDTETHDTGMLYIGGGGCSACGNHYRYNYFFDFAMGDYGIYFDDLSRGMYAYGNIVVGNGTTGDGTTWESGGRSFNVHNGREHCFYNNISIDAGYFAFGGDVTYWLYDHHWNSLYPAFIDAAADKRNDRYMGRNPTYREYVETLDKYIEDKKDPNYVVKSGEAECQLRKPWCNNYENNVIVRAARPFKLDCGEESATSLDTNFVTNEDPGFVDFEGRDYRIRKDAPLYSKIPDFVPPPFEKMGPVDDFAD